MNLILAGIISLCLSDFLQLTLANCVDKHLCSQRAFNDYHQQQRTVDRVKAISPNFDILDEYHKILVV